MREYIQVHLLVESTWFLGSFQGAVKVSEERRHLLMSNCTGCIWVLALVKVNDNTAQWLWRQLQISRDNARKPYHSMGRSSVVCHSSWDSSHHCLHTEDTEAWTRAHPSESTVAARGFYKEGDEMSMWPKGSDFHGKPFGFCPPWGSQACFYPAAICHARWLHLLEYSLCNHWQMDTKTSGKIK